MSITLGTLTAAAIKQYIIKKALDRSFRSATDATRRLLRDKSWRLTASREDVEESLTLHLRDVKNWSEEISFSGLKKAKHTTSVFIELDLFLIPARERIDSREQIQTIALRELFDQESTHFILLGQPGAGKTTSMKRLCQLLLYDDGFYSDRFSFPVLIRCSELNSRHISIFDYIFEKLGLRLALPKSVKGTDRSTRDDATRLREQIVTTFLESFKVLLIVDGFDEIAYENRSTCLADVRKLAYQLDNATLIVTSRTGEFNYNIENAASFQICHLNGAQIEQFALRWLEDKTKAAGFIAKINKTPFVDTAIRPLTLAHLCAIYERVQDIPAKPKTVYKKIVNLLLEEWDQERSIKRTSKYADFEADRKFEFLSQLAYCLTTRLRGTVFSSFDLAEVYYQIYEEHGLEARETERVVGEIESHTGLFLKSGYERYEFAHKSLQEYLGAEFIVKLPSIPLWAELSSVPNELAIATAISSSPGTYFAQLVFRRLKHERLPEDFLRAFLNRLLIERPDFKTDPSVQLALLALLSEYIQLSFIKDGVPSNFQADDVLVGWEALIRQNHSESLTKILDCYRNDSMSDIRKPDIIHRLRFDRNSVPLQLSDLWSDFPNVLFVRTSLIQFRSRKSDRVIAKKK